MSLDFGPTVGDVLFGAVPVRSDSSSSSEASETEKLLSSKGDPQFSCAEPDEPLFGPLHAYWPTAAFIGTQMAWAAQIGYVTPTLRTLGLSDSQVSYAWLAGPIAGICIQPFVGLYSDYTTHSWGRRRIYILCGGLLSIAGLIGFSNAASIGLAVGGSTGSSFALGLAIVFFWFLDFSINISQGVQRPLLADTIMEHEQSQAHAFFALNNGLGKLLGYGLGSISLVSWVGLSWLNTQLRALFTITALVLALTSALTLLNTTERVYEPPPGEVPPSLWVACVKIVNALIHIPKPIHRAFMVQFCAYWGLYSVYIYVSDWFGETIYGGDPEADEDSVSYALYESGVEAANFGLLLAAAVSVCYSLFLPHLVKRLGIRIVWAANLVLFALILFCTMAVDAGDEQSGIFLLALLGFPLAATYQIPWTIVTLTLSKSAQNKRVARFTTIFNMSQCFPEIFVGFLSGLLVDFTGKIVSAFACGGAVVLVGACLCYYVIDPLDQMDWNARQEAFTSPGAAVGGSVGDKGSGGHHHRGGEGGEPADSSQPGGDAAGGAGGSGGVEEEGRAAGAAASASSPPRGSSRHADYASPGAASSV